MGLQSKGLIMGRILAREIWGGVAGGGAASRGLLFAGKVGGLIIEMLLYLINLLC